MARLEASCEALSRSLQEAPKAAEFQPLADHLYDFAQAAPGLVESLRELAEGLAASQASLADALLRMPRPEEYEPLAEPLRHFARASPDLIRGVADLQQRVAPLAASVEGLHRELRERRAAAPGQARAHLEAAAAGIAAARRRLGEALDSLPRDPEYAAVARQLRELATVSPSLMEWLEQVPKLATPLADAAQGLHDTAAVLDAARERLDAAIRELWGEGEPGSFTRPREAPRE